MQLTERTYQFITNHQLISPGDAVLVAVSGGPDSIVLLHLLHTLKERLGISLFGAHLDHMFRGRASQQDAQYVRQFCAALEIPCVIESIDVTSYGKKHHLSSQVAAREVRYHFLNRVADQYQARKIALGHHADDQAETVLLNLLRGTGLNGLAGIAPMRNGRYIRPLLAVRKQAIEQYARTLDLAYRVDSTNYQPVYLRNKIRLALLPHLEEHYNPEIVAALGRLAELSREENKYIEEQTASVFEQLASHRGSDTIILPRKKFNGQPVVLRRRLVRLIWKELMGTAKDLSYQHVEIVLAQCRRPGAGIVELPAGLSCSLNYDEITFSLNNQPQHVPAPWDGSRLLSVPGKLSLPELGVAIETYLYNRQQLKVAVDALPANQAVFDWDTITDQLKICTRQPGARFAPQGAGGTVKLKKFFIDQKIPRAKRWSIPLICSGDEIIWVTGYRIGEYWKVTARTETILHIILRPMVKIRQSLN